MAAPARGGEALGPIIIVGGGIAGLFCALQLAPRPVTLVTPVPLGDLVTAAVARSGMAAAIGDGDSAADHARDTIASGCGLTDEAIARSVAMQAGECIDQLSSLGVVFDSDAGGRPALARSAGHSAGRILRVAGDKTGQAIMAALVAAVLKTPSIRILEGCVARDLRTTGGRVRQVVLVRADDPAAVYVVGPVTDIVLATGGIGGLYAVTTNPAYALGSGIAIAARAGAVIADAEFVEFHPTALDVGADPAPIASEALIGAGARLVDHDGNQLVTASGDDRESPTRDVMARAVALAANGAGGAFFDCRAVGRELAASYPLLVKACAAAGIDPSKQPLPVLPAAHRHIGGVKIDARGATNIGGLWAIGEVAASGLHGANPLASNGLLEVIALAARTARAIAAAHDNGVTRLPARITREKAERLSDRGAEAAALAMIRATMTRNVGVVRSDASLRTALESLAHIASHAEGDQAILDRVLAARFVAEAALRRKESRGLHVRGDFPHSSERLARRISITLAGLDLRSGMVAGDILSIVKDGGRVV